MLINTTATHTNISMQTHRVKFSQSESGNVTSCSQKSDKTNRIKLAQRLCTEDRVLESDEHISVKQAVECEFHQLTIGHNTVPQDYVLHQLSKYNTQQRLVQAII